MRRILYFLLLVSLSGFGQHSITGYITGPEGMPLEGAGVSLDAATTVAETSGMFTFRDAAPGQHRLRVTHTGFNAFDTLIVVERSLQLSIRLIRSRVDLREVAVSARTTSAGSQTSKVRSEDLKRHVSQSLADLLSGVPGVTALRTGSTISKPMVHGLHSSRVPIIINGVRLEDQGWGMDHAPTLAIGQAEKIAVVKGAGTLQYGGDAIGGIVLVEPTDIRIDTLFGSAVTSVSSNGRGGSLNASVTRSVEKGWGWKVKADGKYFGDREAPDYVLSNSGSREYSISADVTRTATRSVWGASASLFRTNLGILRAAHVGNAADLYYSINNAQPYVVDDFTYDIANPRQEVLHLAAKLFATFQPNERDTWKVQYQFQHNNRHEFDIRRGANRAKPALDLTLSTHSLLLDGIRKNEELTLKYGVSGGYQHNFADPDTGVRPLIPTYDRIDAGAYAIAQRDMTARTTLEAGIRYDFSHIAADKFYLKSRWDERGYSPQFDHFIVADAGTQWRVKPRFDYHNLSASVGVRYQPGTWDLMLSLGRNVRNPNPAELFSDGLHHSTGMIELGSLSLKQEKATKATLEISRRAENWNMSISPFINQITDFMYLYPVGFETTIRGVFPVWEFRQDNALIAGADIHGEWRITPKWRYSAQASWLYGWNESQSQYLIDMPPPNLTQKVGYAADWHRLKLELSHLLVARQTRYPDANFDTNIVVDGALTPVTVDISTPPSGYGLWNFYGEMTFAFARQTLTTGIGIQNIADKSYRNYLNRQRYFADEVGRNIMVQICYNF